MGSKHRIRVAIVGSGMAGLVTAYLLKQDVHRRYAVTLFEAGNQLSLDSASVTVQHSSRASPERVDLPMRAFAGGFYSNLKAMYDHLGVEYRDQSFLFEFSEVHTRGQRGSKPYFIHASNNHRTPPTRPRGIGLFQYLGHILYLLICYIWFSVCCHVVTPKSSTSGACETFAEYLKRVRLPQYFVTYFLLPLMSSVTTCPHEVLLEFPARDLTEYKRTTTGAPHYTVSNGVQKVQSKLVEGINYKLSTFVSSVEYRDRGVILRSRTAESLGHAEEIFDRVVLAVSPDIVAKIFEPLQISMAKIPTLTVESIIHNDWTTMDLDANEKRRTSPAQSILLKTSTEGVHRTEAIHVQPSGALVTTCPFTPIDSSLVIRSSKFTRVLRTPESRHVVNTIFGSTATLYQEPLLEKQPAVWRNGDQNVWLVGGWCWDGMVLLEGCVVSAMRVADAFEVEIPWRKDEFVSRPDDQ